MGATLRIQWRTTTLLLSPGENAIIGRDPSRESRRDALLRIPLESISRTMISITWAGGPWTVTNRSRTRTADVISHDHLPYPLGPGRQFLVEDTLRIFLERTEVIDLQILKGAGTFEGGLPQHEGDPTPGEVALTEEEVLDCASLAAAFLKDEPGAEVVDYKIAARRRYCSWKTLEGRIRKLRLKLATTVPGLDDKEDLVRFVLARRLVTKRDLDMLAPEEEALR